MTRTTKHTDDDQLTSEAEELLDNLDPSRIAEADRMEDLRVIREIADDLDKAQQYLTLMIARARHNGRSWGDIALVLGVARQSVHAKYHAAVDEILQRRPLSKSDSSNLPDLHVWFRTSTKVLDEALADQIEATARAVLGARPKR